MKRVYYMVEKHTVHNTLQRNLRLSPQTTLEISTVKISLILP